MIVVIIVLIGIIINKHLTSYIIIFALPIIGIKKWFEENRGLSFSN